MDTIEDRKISAGNFSFWIALATSIVTLGTFATAFMTPPLSGPYCVAEKCFTYPYADIAARFPRDYYWMYPAMLLSLLYVALFACVYDFASKSKKIFGLLGLSMAVISAAVLFMDYYVQTAVIQPSLLSGEMDGISLLTQFNSHGVFIALEEVGYILLAVSFMCIVPVFSKENLLERWLRWLLAGGFSLLVLSFIYCSMRYGLKREYRFEVAAISIDWLVLIAAGIMIAVVFHRGARR